MIELEQHAGKLINYASERREQNADELRERRTTRRVVMRRRKLNTSHADELLYYDVNERDESRHDFVRRIIILYRARATTRMN